MISSGSCSSRATALLAAVALAGASCAHGGGAPATGRAADGGTGTSRDARERRPHRLALFPLENLTGHTAPVREMGDAVETALARAGVEVVSGDAVEQFLAAHRVRYTGGIEGEIAAAARDELGVDGIVVASAEADQEGPRFGIVMRAVAARSDAPLMWTDGMSRAGDDSPGLLGLGIVRDPAKLREQVLRPLSGSLVAALDGTGPRAPGCGSSGRFQPRLRYRSELLERGKTYSVAVVPFRNLSSRRNAGDVVALEFLRALATDTRFQPMEPGVVRASILKNRVVMEGGISVDQVRTLLGSIGADLVLAGDVLSWFDGGVPRVDVNVTMLDGRTGEIVWESGSSSRGDDGVFLFGVGTVGTAGTLSCRIARAAVNEMFRAKASPRPRLAQPEPDTAAARIWRPSKRAPSGAQE